MQTFFSEDELRDLEYKVSLRMGKDRFAHTLGVAEVAQALGERIIPSSVSELRAAALLHDVAKELREADMAEEIMKIAYKLSADDISCAAAHHSFVAPEIIKRDFPMYATEDILTSIYEHTLGAPCMSLFSRIIFLSDYIEPGRKYVNCKATREYVFSLIGDSFDEAVKALNFGAIMALDHTHKFLVDRGKSVHPNLILARNYISTLI